MLPQHRRSSVGNAGSFLILAPNRRARPALAGGEEGGERDLVILDTGGMLHDAFAVRCPGIDAEGEVSSKRRGHLGSFTPFFLGGRCVGQALATEAITECARSGSVGEAESNIELLDFVSTPAAPDWDALFTVERINL